MSRKLNLLNEKFNDLEQLMQPTTDGPTGDNKAAASSASANETDAR